MRQPMETLWQEDVETTCQEYANNQLSFQQAWRDLTLQLGIDSDEASDWLQTTLELGSIQL